MLKIGNTDIGEREAGGSGCYRDGRQLLIVRIGDPVGELCSAHKDRGVRWYFLHCSVWATRVNCLAYPVTMWL